MKNNWQKNVLLILLASISLGSYSCSFIGNCVEGEGKIVEESLDLEEFSEIEVYGASKVHLTQGDKQSVSIKAQSNLIELLNKEVNGDTWEIKFKKCVQYNEGVEIFIVVPDLNEIGIHGSGEVIGEDVFHCKNLELDIKGSGEIRLNLRAEKVESNIAGSGDIILEGKTNAHSISIQGSGDIAAYELEAADTEVDIKGSGDVKVNTNSSLDVEIYGSGDVYYRGDVQNVSSEIRGSGNLSRK